MPGVLPAEVLPAGAVPGVLPAEVLPAAAVAPAAAVPGVLPAEVLPAAAVAPGRAGAQVAVAVLLAVAVLPADAGAPGRAARANQARLFCFEVLPVDRLLRVLQQRTRNLRSNRDQLAAFAHSPGAERLPAEPATGHPAELHSTVRLPALLIEEPSATRQQESAPPRALAQPLTLEPPQAHCWHVRWATFPPCVPNAQRETQLPAWTIPPTATKPVHT